jgi:hypothetical protein
MHWSAARPLFTVATILAVTAVTSCSASGTTPAVAGAVGSTPAVKHTVANVTPLGQGDADSLSLAAKQYLNKVVDPSGKTTWSVTFSRAASSASGELTFVGFMSPAEDGSFQAYNQSVATACATTSSSVLAAGHPTGATFVTVKLGVANSGNGPDLQIQEWDAVAPPAAVRALTQMATTCGSRLVIRPNGPWRVVDTSVAQPVQVLGSPAVAIQVTQTPLFRQPWNSLIAFSGARMLAVSSRALYSPDIPPLPNDVLAELASALLRPSGG